VFTPQAAYIVNDILADPLARGRLFGGSQIMNPMLGLALKTGTSTHYRDCWCVGYAPEFTVAVWVGNFSGQPTTTLSGSTAAAPLVIDLVREVYTGNAPGEFPRPEGIVRRTVCAFSGLIPGPGCVHQRQELFIAGAEPTRTCTYHQPRDPWHRMPTPFAGWLQKRHHQGGEGRFRLAGFSPDLDRVFPHRAPVHPTPSGPQPHTGKVSLGSAVMVGKQLRPRPSFPGQAPEVSISYPLHGDRFLLPPGTDSLRLTMKAACQKPVARITWFVNGQEKAASGPPYELTLDLTRGRHHLTVVGPDGLGDAVEVGVE
jgi:membrane carboxypeptidase/penicillin-binding protein PbpC